MLFYPYSAFEIARTLVGYKAPIVFANGFSTQEGEPPRALPGGAVPPTEEKSSLMFVRNAEAPARLAGNNVIANVDRPAKVRRIEGFNSLLWKSISARFRPTPPSDDEPDTTPACLSQIVRTARVGCAPSKDKGIRRVRFDLPVEEDD